MGTIITNLRKAAERHAAYSRTVAELEAVPTGLAVEDLGFYPGDARRIARVAVYGK